MSAIHELLTAALIPPLLQLLRAAITVTRKLQSTARSGNIS